MYNNDVTYDKKWDTEENLKYLELLKAKYFARSVCGPSCPTGWSKEVYELLETIDKELGIARNTQTVEGYNIQGGMLKWFIKDPFRGLYYATKNQFASQNSLLEKLKVIQSRFFEPIGEGFKKLKVLYWNPLVNKVLKPKVVLSQFKEKYGYLTLYVDAPEAYKEWIDSEKRKTVVKLALKGCYYPIESLWDYSTSFYVETEYSPDTFEVKKGINSYDNKPYTQVTKTLYRQAMKDLGLNLDEIATKAMIEASKEEKFP